MSKQLDAVYDYMIKNGKYLSKDKKITSINKKTVKKISKDKVISVFNANLQEVWKGKNPRLGKTIDDNFKYWSLRLGKSYTYLCVYRKTHNLFYLTPYELFLYVQTKDKEMQKVKDKLQAIYYELQTNRQISNFSIHLKNMSLVGNPKSLYSLFENCFNSGYFILKNKIPYYEKIIAEYSNFKNLTHGD